MQTRNLNGNLIKRGQHILKGAGMPVMILLLFCHFTGIGQAHFFSTRYATIRVSGNGYITSIKDKAINKEYGAAGDSSALLSLYKDNVYILPVSASFDPAHQLMILAYSNGSVARVRIQSKRSYLRMELLSLSPRNGVDNIVWGP